MKLQHLATLHGFISCQRSCLNNCCAESKKEKEIICFNYISVQAQQAKYTRANASTLIGTVERVPANCEYPAKLV